MPPTDPPTDPPKDPPTDPPTDPPAEGAPPPAVLAPPAEGAPPPAVLALPAKKPESAPTVPPRRRKAQLHWDPSFTHAGVADYVFAGAGVTALIVEAVALQPLRPPLHWTDPILFDVEVRKAMRPSDPYARTTAGNVSWTLWAAQVAYPVLVDIPYAWARYGPRIAQDLLWQDLVTLTIAGAVDLAIRDLTGRARPPTYDCLSRGGTDCLDGTESTRSFPGGHTANSTAASVLTCTQHLYLKLYGGPWDVVTCAATLVSNFTLAAMRIATDNHWMTDQIAGIAIGALLGWGVPWLMHFRHRGQKFTAPPELIVLPAPMAVYQGIGLAAVGFF